jgi:hypothetical protein
LPAGIPVSGKVGGAVVVVGIVVVVVVGLVVVVAFSVVVVARVVGVSVVEALSSSPPPQAARTAAAARATAIARRGKGFCIMGTSELTERGDALLEGGMGVEEPVEAAEPAAVAHP